MARDASKVQISATVPAEVRLQLVQRASLEDRTVGIVLARAVEVYLSLPFDEAQRLVEQARGYDENGNPPS